jgi:hypothetical protein
MLRELCGSTIPGMASYAVVWRVGDGPVRAGKLELDRYGFVLEGVVGTNGERRSLTHRVDYEDILAVRVGRASTERIVGQPVLVVELAVGGPLAVGSIDGPGTLHELGEQLGKLTATKLAV